MRLRPIREDKWTILTPLDKNGECPLLDSFAALQKKNKGAMANLASSIKRVAENNIGPGILSKDRSHYVDQKNKIYEFIAGRYRLLWFQSPSEQRIIICSHLFMKKTQKAPTREVNKALRVKKDYLAALHENKVEVIKPEEKS
jgi:hypothetical protein